MFIVSVHFLALLEKPFLWKSFKMTDKFGDVIVFDSIYLLVVIQNAARLGNFLHFFVEWVHPVNDYYGWVRRHKRRIAVNNAAI